MGPPLEDFKATVTEYEAEPSSLPMLDNEILYSLERSSQLPEVPLQLRLNVLHLRIGEAALLDPLKFSAVMHGEEMVRCLREEELWIGLNPIIVLGIVLGTSHHFDQRTLWDELPCADDIEFGGR